MANKIAFLCLGSNVGNRKENIANAISLISSRCEIVKESSLYETKPWGFVNQESFLNSAVKISTLLSVIDLFKFCKSVEEKLGKKKMFLNGPRLIDVDLIFYEDVVYSSSELVVPHPRFFNRAFNLIPLLEIEDVFHPVFKKKISELLKECDLSDVARLS